MADRVILLQLFCDKNDKADLKSLHKSFFFLF